MTTNNDYAPLPIARALAEGVPCRACGGSGASCPDCNGAGVRVYPQDGWPQVVYRKRNSLWELEWQYNDSFVRARRLDGFMDVEYYAAPVAITNDGGGWLPWLAKALDVIVEWYGGRQWRAYYADGASGHADSPLALGEAMLRRAGLLGEEVKA